MSIDQALLYFVDLRLQVRHAPEACAIVDRCLSLLAQARTADPATMSRLEAELDALREELRSRLGRPPRLKAH